MKKDRNSLFSNRCQHLDLVTTQVKDRFDVLLFNIHHYHYFKDEVRIEEICAERDDEILSLCLVKDTLNYPRIDKIMISISSEATVVLSRKDINLFENVTGY